MDPQKSPGDVRLLKPEHLRQIRAAVLRWVRDNPADIRAKMQQALEMLESIIRYRLRDKLAPATPKAPVLGGIGVAYAPDDYDENKRSIYMDTGMAIFLANALGEPVGVSYPLPIYGGVDLRDYPGTVMPGGGTEYLMKRGEGDTCPSWPASFTWGSQGEYSSDLYAEFDDLATLYGPCAVTALHTGFTRLAVQAKVGAGRSAAELSPWSAPEDICNLNPYSDGIFRDDNYVYWVFRTDSDGCKCARLTTDQKHALCIADWLENGDLTGDDALKAEAYLLSTLEVERDESGTLIEYTLLTSGDLSSVYSDSKEPLGETGWHYSRGHHGVDEGLVYECAIVTHKIVTEGDPVTAAYRQATLSVVEFDVSGLVPTATLVQDEIDVDWEPSTNDFIFYPVITETETKLCYVDHAAAFVFSPRGAGAPLYAFYAEDGIDVLRYSYRNTSGLVTDLPDPVQICGFGGDTQTGVQYFGGTGKSGDIYTDRSDIHLATQQPDNIFAAHKYIEWQLVVSSTGAGKSFTAGSRSQIEIWASGACNGLDVSGWPDSSIDYDVSYGTASGFRTETRVTGSNVTRNVVIPHGDSEAVMLCELVTGAVSSQTKQEYSDWETVDSRYKLTPQIDMDKASEGFSASVNVPISPGSMTQWWIIGGDYFIANMRATAGTTLPSGSTYKQCYARIVTSKGILGVAEGVSQDYDDWTEWAAVELLPENCHPTATCWTQTSYYHGDSWFSGGPASSKVLFNGYAIATQPSTESYSVVPLGWN